MAIFARTNGDANGVVNVDVGSHGTDLDVVIATGIANNV
jgi:hypothetical protein